MFSTNNYGQDDDFYGVGYIMEHIVRPPIYVHPDPDYNELSEDLKAKRCDITYALDLAQRKYTEMTTGYDSQRILDLSGGNYELL